MSKASIEGTIGTVRTAYENKKFSNYRYMPEIGSEILQSRSLRPPSLCVPKPMKVFIQPLYKPSAQNRVVSWD